MSRKDYVAKTWPSHWDTIKAPWGVLTHGVFERTTVENVAGAVTGEPVCFCHSAEHAHAIADALNHASGNYKYPTDFETWWASQEGQLPAFTEAKWLAYQGWLASVAAVNERFQEVLNRAKSG